MLQYQGMLVLTLSNTRLVRLEHLQSLTMEQLLVLVRMQSII